MSDSPARVTLPELPKVYAPRTAGRGPALIRQNVCGHPDRRHDRHGRCSSCAEIASRQMRRAAASAEEHSSDILPRARTLDPARLAAVLAAGLLVLPAGATERLRDTIAGAGGMFLGLEPTTAQTVRLTLGGVTIGEATWAALETRR